MIDLYIHFETLYPNGDRGHSNFCQFMIYTDKIESNKFEIFFNNKEMIYIWKLEDFYHLEDYFFYKIGTFLNFEILVRFA